MKRLLALPCAILLACLCFACGVSPKNPVKESSASAALLTLYADKQPLRIATQREGVKVTLQKVEHEPTIGFVRPIADEWEETLVPGREYELPRVPTAGLPEYRLFVQQGETIALYLLTSGGDEVIEIEGEPWAPAPIDADSPMIGLCRAAAIAPNEEQYDYWYAIANAITTLRAVDRELPPDEDEACLVDKWLFDAYAAALFPGVEAPNLVGCPWVNYRPEEYDGYYVDPAYSTWLSAEYRDAKQNPDGIWDVTIKVRAPMEEWEWDTVIKLAPNERYNPDSPFEYRIINLAPEKFHEEAVRPLLYRIGIALSRDYVEDFDAARGAMADRCFTDALLYEFLNDELYDERIQPVYGEEYLCRLTAEDMLFLLRQYIGDYPKLIDTTVDMFLSRNRAGDYEYWHSDLGAIDYELRTGAATYAGGGVFEIDAELYMHDDADGTTELLGIYTLRFVKADDAAYGYTIQKITKG